MAQLKYIKSASEIPVGPRYVIIKYGASALEIRHSRGTVVVAAGGSADQYGLEKAFERGRVLAEREGLSTVYVIDRRREPRHLVRDRSTSGLGAEGDAESVDAR
jgi:phosphate-selective porin